MSHSSPASGRTRKRRSPGRSSSICVRTSMAAQPRVVRRLPRPSRRTPRPRPPLTILSLRGPIAARTNRASSRSAVAAAQKAQEEQESPATGVTADSCVPSSAGGRGHLPRPRGGVAFIIKWQNEPKFNFKQSHICFSRKPCRFRDPVALAFVWRMPDARSVRASATRGGRESAQCLVPVHHSTRQ